MPSQTPIQLIVGLANPGSDYAQTRHNAGEWFIDSFRESLNSDKKLKGRIGQTRVDGHECRLFIPNTYMNESGQAVVAAANYYKIPPEAILVAHDELDLDPGNVKLKFDGGHAGHNGLRDIIQKLGSRAFWRLRIGIGHPGQSHLVTSYVLGKPNKADKQIITNAIEDSQRIVGNLLDGQFEKAMQLLHT